MRKDRILGKEETGGKRKRERILFSIFARSDSFSKQLHNRSSDFSHPISLHTFRL